MVIYLTTLFLGKPPGGSLLFLNQRMRDFFPRKNVPAGRVNLGTATYQADTLPTSYRARFSLLVSSAIK